jgi:hypothetical protein
MRFSAISSRVKSCVSISTVDGSFVTAAGRIGVVVGIKPGAELHRKTLPKDCTKDEVELGMEAILSELARSLSTAAFTRYAIAKRVVSFQENDRY